MIVGEIDRGTIRWPEYGYPDTIVVEVRHGFPEGKRMQKALERAED